MKIKNIIIGKIKKDSFLLEKLSEIVKENKINCGIILGIGAIQNLNFGFYNQEKHEYKTITINKPLEVLNLTGNISIKENSPFVHCHITCADEDGKVYGGHLFEGTKVFAFEYKIFEVEGKFLIRNFDNLTGLFLWER